MSRSDGFVAGALGQVVPGDGIELGLRGLCEIEDVDEVFDRRGFRFGIGGGLEQRGFEQRRGQQESAEVVEGLTAA